MLIKPTVANFLQGIPFAKAKRMGITILYNMLQFDQVRKRTDQRELLNSLSRMVEFQDSTEIEQYMKPN